MKDLFSLSGKVALVTGGSRGIGEMIARGYVANGVRTYISSRSAEACDALAAELSEQGQCISVPADLSAPAGLMQVVKTITEHESALHILVNNAGANWGAALEEYPPEGWDKVMTLNVKSPFFLTQQLLPLLRQAAREDDPARVINVGSIDGIGVSSLPTYAYGASKAALHHLTLQLARWLAKDAINVNAIAPGPFETKMMAATLAAKHDQVIAAVPRGRIGQADDMAGTAIFLAAAASSYITGAILPVDGGMETCR